MAALRAAGIIIAMILIGGIVATMAPRAGYALGIAIMLVAAVAIIRPMPKIFLGSRWVSLLVLVLPGLLTLGAAVNKLDEPRLAELRNSDPSAYLAEIERKDRRLWMQELEELDPDRYAQEAAKRDARAEQEAAQKADAGRARTERAEADARENVASYLAQLERESAAIPAVRASSYTEDVKSIQTALLLLGAWSVVYENGGRLSLDADGEKKRQAFRRLLSAKQVEMLPALRDAYGPAMRRVLWEADGSAKTFGAGYRTIEFVARDFVRNANIKDFQEKIQESLMMLRFNRSQFKWYANDPEYTYFDLRSPADSEIVKWVSGGRYHVLE